jgi:hypothetical protein
LGVAASAFLPGGEVFFGAADRAGAAAFFVGAFAAADFFAGVAFLAAGADFLAAGGVADFFAGVAFLAAGADFLAGFEPGLTDGAPAISGSSESKGRRGAKGGSPGPVAGGPSKSAGL